MKLSGVGVWSSQLRYGDAAEAVEAAAELEQLGFRTFWIPDGGGPIIESVERLLSATREVVVASGVLNLWMHSAAEVAGGCARLSDAYGHRFLLGIGVGHASRVNATEPGRYRNPLGAMTTFLDELDQADRPVPIEERVLAALGPKMIQLAASRSAGVHPYLVTPEGTAKVREALGEGALVVPEQTAILCSGRDAARAIGAPWLDHYLKLPNYANNLLRIGFTPSDLETISDRLFDGLIAWGDEVAIGRRVAEHIAAGADQVAVQVVSESPGLPRPEWRRLATALL